MPKNKYKMLIITSWVVLIICFIIKICGGNWFELETNNNRFVAFCNYVDNNLVLKIILACCIYLFTTIPIFMIEINNNKSKIILFVIPLMIFKSIISWYIVWLSYVLDFIIIIIIPLIIAKGNWKRILICNLLVFSFQVITLITRNLSLWLNDKCNTFIEQCLLQIDYYIMILLFCLYNFNHHNKKESEV